MAVKMGPPSCLTLGADPKKSETRNNFGDASKWMMLTSYFRYKIDIFSDFPIISYLFWDCYTSVGLPPGCDWGFHPLGHVFFSQRWWAPAPVPELP